MARSSVCPGRSVRLVSLFLTTLLVAACPAEEPSGGGGSGGSAGGAGGVSSGSGGSGGVSSTTGSGGSVTGSGGNNGGGGGGSPVDSGRDSATGVDSGADAAGERPANGDCPEGALVCDDFEGYALGGSANLQPNWEVQEIEGQVTVDSSKPFRGTKGVRLTTKLSPPGEPVRTHGGPLRAATLIKQGAPLFPVAGNAFWGRAMIWLTKMPNNTHFSNIEATGRTPQGEVVKWGMGGMFRKLKAGYTIRPMAEFDLPRVDCYKDGTIGVPEGAWVCAEWQFDGAAQEARMWFDGMPQPVLEVTRTSPGTCGNWQMPAFDKFYLGWRHSQVSEIDVEMWMDDVVIDTKRVGCPAPRP